ncbi:disease resistance-like protein DSC2 [Rosa rugosa]|uniref:disease resistance-like protein DSC2 n=1 Tax=Rosa rugosa TaxID=74645 RepID=UPI002B401400|nr:disease resistance-like protein DSC2 [Rosa rugosa]
MQLFCWNAFTGRLDGMYLLLAQVAVHHAQGIPLALVVLGSCLYGESWYDWTDVLDDLKRVVDRKQVTQEILKICYNALEDLVKEVFLQIACSFDGQKQINLMKELAHFVPNLMHGIQVLTEKAFINIGASHVPITHELLKEMATELVRQKSANKLWDSKFWILRDFCVYLPKYSAIRIAKDIMKKWSKPHEIPFSTTELAEFWSKISMHGSYVTTSGGIQDFQKPDFYKF